MIKCRSGRTPLQWVLLVPLGTAAIGAIAVLGGAKVGLDSARNLRRRFLLP